MTPQKWGRTNCIQMALCRFFGAEPRPNLGSISVSEKWLNDPDNQSYPKNQAHDAV